MKVEEWEAIGTHLETCFKGEMTDEKRVTYMTFLGDADEKLVMAALHKMVQGGQVWLPTPGEIVLAMREVATGGLPSWQEVWSQIEKAMCKSAAGCEWRSGLHPTVVAFLEVDPPERLRMLPFYDPEHGELRIHQLRTRFEEFADVQQSRANSHVAIAAAGLPLELERGPVAALPAAT